MGEKLEGQYAKEVDDSLSLFGPNATAASALAFAIENSSRIALALHFALADGDFP